MRRVEEIVADPASKWEQDQYGLVMRFGKGYEVRLETLLFGATYLAVYVNEALIGEKVPVTLGTPAHNRKT